MRRSTKLRPMWPRRLSASARGSAIVEFALIAPVVLGLMLGVLQVGVGMQRYNALRNVSAEVARYAVVNYQASNRLTVDQINSYARLLATRAPYSLDGTRLTVTVTQPSTQRVTDVTEYSLKLDYEFNSRLKMLKIGNVIMSYTRPIFVPKT